jgi:hypothetical protein
MERSGEIHAPAPLSLALINECPPAPVRIFWEGKNLFSLPGIETQIDQPKAYVYID